MQAQFLALLNKHEAMIQQAIGRHWNIPEGVSQKLSCQLLVRLRADGSVVDVSLQRSSGNKLLDDSAVSAVIKASPLPIPSDPEINKKFRELSLTVRPEGLLS